MNEKKILYLCLRLGGTVYETIRMANQETLVALMEFIKELIPPKPRLSDRCPTILIERARPMLVELAKDPRRRDCFHQNCVGTLSMGQFLAETVAVIKYSSDGSGKITDEEEEFIKQVEAVAARF